MKTLAVVLIFAVMTSSAVAGNIKPMRYALQGSLGVGAKKDILLGNCPFGTSPAVTSVKVSVGDKAPVNPPIIKVQVKKVSSKTCTATILASGAIQQDNIDGDTQIWNGYIDPVFSAYSAVAAGNGTAFRIEVFKTEPNGVAESYGLNYHCENWAINHPTPTLTYCQNQ